MMRMMLGVLLALLLVSPAIADDPIRIEGNEQSMLDDRLPDGGLPPVVGVRNYQVFRASRVAKDITDGKGWTYNHHIDMACWHGRLYVAWTNGEKDEDTWPAHEVYSTSIDGVTWTAPAELFPLGISNPMRMYFYHTKNGHMLVIDARRIILDSSERVKDVAEGGAVVREILADHSLGPVYTLIKSPKAPTGPAFFADSKDKAFVEACREMLADHTFLEQEDYGELLGDQRMAVYNDSESDFGKAFCFYHRKDGALVGICKKGYVVESTNNGLTWSSPVRLQEFRAGTAKEWIQRTSDGRFAWAHDPFPANRFPLVVLTGDDGITFGNMRVVHGEVPRQRYDGAYKNIGPQYVRGISEWNSDSSRNDGFLWMAYSVNKEDIWVSRVPVPLESRGNGWNFYVPKWADVSWADGRANTTLRLEDHDPWDYARADRVFLPAKTVTAEFEVMPKHPGPGDLEIECWGEFNDARPVSVVLKPDGNIATGQTNLGKYAAGEWIKFQISADVARGEFEVSINGAPAGHFKFTDQTDALDRLVFRTGPYRLLPTRGDEVPANTDVPAESSEYLVRAVTIR